MAREACPVDRALAFLDPLLGCRTGDPECRLLATSRLSDHVAGTSAYPQAADIQAPRPLSHRFLLLLCDERTYGGAVVEPTERWRRTSREGKS